MAGIFVLYTLVALSHLFGFTSAFSNGIWGRALPSNVTATLIPPSKDPWYTAPPGYGKAAPGAVLRVRKLSNSLALSIVNCSAIYNVLYKTTDSNYKPSWAVTTLFTPLTNSNSTRNGSTSALPGSVLLSYQTAFDSASLDMSASYAFYFGGTDPNVPAALGYGWYVSMPDYEGPRASFVAGVQSGHAVIDSIRAILKSRLGVAAEAKYAMLGYSAGGAASGWAAELQVQYAPEMTFAGAAIGGLAPNVTNTFESVNDTPFAEIIPNGILGLTSQDKTAQHYIISQLKTSGPYNTSGFLAARTQNTAVDAVQYANQNILDYFKSGSAVLQAPAILANINRDAIMGYHGIPAMPVYVYKAIGDEISPVADTDVLVDRYCGVGANILYQRNTVGGHLAEAYNGFSAGFAFLRAVLGGTYADEYQTTGCTIRNVTVTVDTSPE